MEVERPFLIIKKSSAFPTNHRNILLYRNREKRRIL
jgi:hypothetical protein